MKRLLGPVALGCLFMMGCQQDAVPRSEAESHWLDQCNADADCGGGMCVCGVCTDRCDPAEACRADARPACANVQQLAAVCGQPIAACVRECDVAADCGRGDFECRQGICAAADAPPGGAPPEPMPEPPPQPEPMPEPPPQPEPMPEPGPMIDSCADACERLLVCWDAICDRPGSLLMSVCLDNCELNATNIDLVRDNPECGPMVRAVTDAFLALDRVCFEAPPEPEPMPAPEPEVVEPEPQPDPGEPEPQPDPGEPEPQPDPGEPEPQPDPGEPEPQPDPGEPEPGEPEPGEPEPQPQPDPDPDLCPEAVGVLQPGVPTAYDTRNAGRVDAACGGPGNQIGLYYDFVLDEPSTVTIITQNIDYDSVLELRPACDIAERICNDDGGVGLASAVRDQPLAAGVHRVVVTGFSDGGGQGEVLLEVAPGGPEPEPEPDPMPLVCPEPVERLLRAEPSDFDSADGVLAPDGCRADPTRLVWFELPLAGETDVLLETIGGPLDTYLVVWPNCDGEAAICDDNGGIGGLSRIEARLPAGRHLIGAGSASPRDVVAQVRLTSIINDCDNGIDDDGDGQIDFPADPDCTGPRDTEIHQCLPEPAPDFPAEGRAIGRHAIEDASRYAASCGGAGAPEAVWRYTVAPGTERLTISANHPGTEHPVVLSVRRQCQDPAGELACSAVNAEPLVLDQPAPGDYYIFVDGVANDAPGQARWNTGVGELALVDPQGYVPNPDIGANGWGDGGRDAFDSFGRTTLSTLDDEVEIDVSPGRRIVDVGDERVEIVSTLVQNTWRLQLLPVGEVGPFRVEMTGNVGSDGATMAQNEAIVLGGQRLPYMRTQDDGMRDPPIVYLMVPSVPRDTERLRYDNQRDNITLRADGVALPLTIYVTPSYAPVEAVLDTLVDDIEVIGAADPDRLGGFEITVDAE